MWTKPLPHEALIASQKNHPLDPKKEKRKKEKRKRK